MITISCTEIVKAHKIHSTFRYCLHKSPMYEAGFAGCTEILNPDVTDGGPPLGRLVHYKKESQSFGEVRNFKSHKNVHEMCSKVSPSMKPLVLISLFFKIYYVAANTF